MPWNNAGNGHYGAIAGMDHRADWLLGPGMGDFLLRGEETLIPFIMVPREQQAVDAVKKLIAKPMAPGRPGPPLYIPSNYTDAGLKIDRYFTAHAPKKFFDDLVTGDGTYEVLRKAAKGIRLCTPIASAAPDWQQGEPIVPLEDLPIGPPANGWPKGTVVIGIIDNGIAFAHEHFRRAAGAVYTSRVECFWRQEPGLEGLKICKADNDGKPGIDTLLAQSVVGGSVDEDMLYRVAGLTDFAKSYHNSTAWRASHGTHVLDLVAGANPTKEDVANRPIICVQLPTVTTADTSGKTDLTNKVIDGIDYILRRAEALSGVGSKLPVVINFSYGTIAERHDGTSDLEDAIEVFIDSYVGELRFVLPAGNSHLSRTHAEVKFLKKTESVTLEVRVQPDDLTPSYLEIWLPHAGPEVPASDRLKVSIEAPDGKTTPELGEADNTGVHITNDDGNIICAANYAFKTGQTERGVFLVNFQPSARLGPTSPPEDADVVVLSGTWKIKLQNVRLKPKQLVHAWIQRDDNLYSYPRRGRQAYFDHACYVRFDTQGREIEDDNHPQQLDCLVTRASLVNALATSARSIVAGGFQRKDYRVARYSAGGPIMPNKGVPPGANLRKPDACMVSEDSKVHVGVLGAGVRSGSTVAFSGTSVAAPQLARLIANKLADGQTGDRLAVKAIAEAEEGANPGRPPLPPNRGGWGRITRSPVVALPR